MKKLLAIAIVLMMVPFSAFAMEMISDSDMDAVTGQAGVSIAVDNIKIYQHIEKIEYKDTDGYAGETAGIVGIGSITQKIEILAIGSSSNNTTVKMADYGMTDADASPLTIDVTGDLSALGYQMKGASKAGVIIGLPTVQITVEEFTLNPYLSDGTTKTSFGEITIGNQTTAILGGMILISAH